MKLILHGTPNSRQREFFLSRARHTAYGGARGGGKSWAMRRKFVLPFPFHQKESHVVGI